MSKNYQERRSLMRAQGLCLMCGKPKVAEDLHLNNCVACRRKVADNTSKYRNTNTEKGLCPICGRNSIAQGRKKCDGCVIRYKYHSNQYKTNRVENNLCLRCGKSPNEPNLQQCFDCILKYRVKSLNLRTDHKLDWKQAKYLWEYQSGICPVSGRPLTINDAELDHIIPLSKGGSNSIDNMRWTHIMINRAKHNRSEDDLITLIRDAYLHLTNKGLIK